MSFTLASQTILYMKLISSHARTHVYVCMVYLVMLPQMHICVHGIERVILSGLVRGKLIISMIVHIM